MSLGNKVRQRSSWLKILKTCNFFSSLLDVEDDNEVVHVNYGDIGSKSSAM